MKSIKQPARLRKRQHIGIAVGGLMGVVAIGVMAFDEMLHAPGPMDPGHANLKCDDCHRKAPGTLRQQLQATVRYWIGLRDTSVSVGHLPVANEFCLDCHDRPKDRHPVYRFLEPRYKRAREAIAPQFCNSCHREHQGKRISIELDFCSSCHDKLALKKDPIDVSHKDLAATKRWDTCLGCHDFHGNHRMALREVFNDRIPRWELARYFDDGDSPYSKDKYYLAHKTLEENDHH